MKVVLDSGALIAIDRRDREMGSQLLLIKQKGTPVQVSSAVIGQVWRDGRKQANLARVLTGIDVAELGQADGTRIGALLAKTGSSDVVDAHVVLMADHGDLILTSDPADIRQLVLARNVSVRVQLV